jgi:hypothetical protein
MVNLLTRTTIWRVAGKYAPGAAGEVPGVVHRLDVLAITRI